MKTKLLFSVLMATSMTAGLAVASPQQSSVAGSAAPSNATADQVIVITDTTGHINVAGGSTVRFVIGDQSFAWSFQNGTAHVAPFDLENIAPKGMLNHPVTTYVSDSSAYANP